MMSEDIHKWTDGRYTLMFGEYTFFVWDNEKDKRMTALQTTKRLNEQQATIKDLKEENEKLRNIHLSIDLTYSYGYGRYLADVRVIDDE